MSELRIEFGAMARPLREQIGRRLHVSRVRMHQADVDAVTRLAVRGMLTESEAARVRKRIVKRIAWEIEAIEAAT